MHREHHRGRSAALREDFADRTDFRERQSGAAEGDRHHHREQALAFERVEGLAREPRVAVHRIGELRGNRGAALRGSAPAGLGFDRRQHDCSVAAGLCGGNGGPIGLSGFALSGSGLRCGGLHERPRRLGGGRIQQRRVHAAAFACCSSVIAAAIESILEKSRRVSKRSGISMSK